MKKIFISLCCLFSLCLASPSFSAETIVQEDTTLYLLHLSRGPENNAISATDFHNFLRKELAPILSTGLTVIESKGQVYDKQGKMILQTTSIVEIVSDDPSLEEKIYAVATKYADTFKKHKLAAFVVTVPHAKSALFY